MRKHHPKNERIKRQYFDYLKEAKRMDISSVDMAAAAIAGFEQWNKHKDFALFHIEQAKSFKAHLNQCLNERTGKPLAKATIYSRLMTVKAFFFWLAGQTGYRSRISYSDSDYFNPSANDGRIATARRDQRVPSLDQVHRVIGQMPADTDLQRRDRAVIAFILLTGARDSAVASLKIKHVDIPGRKLWQDAREVNTKNRKTFTTWFFPVGGDAEAIVAAWLKYLVDDLNFGPDDPLFPATQVGQRDGLFVAEGLSRNHWGNAAAIRKAFRSAFVAVGLPYANPHSIRNVLAALGERKCRTPEEFKAWSQNLGHDHVLTTFTSYGSVPATRQAEIFASLNSIAPKQQGDVGMLDELAALLEKMRHKA